ncbi:hypothetical protein GCM10011380_04620 [Sphingomonas metalli]|uniref:SPOR domain-containing protein n=1 Tax=Sphingomonas metalli TaxID=1779358 RepID=A0A916WPH3_9SPHN|nr:SPOR domain-containing protein [Sphingomonas metalli]GGB18118.1 hypothetical protein GCM10011380_04620 [Sphingomonas metalli]
MRHPLRLTASALPAAALAAAFLPQAAVAQAVVQSLEQSDADLLATQMRQLASNPRDVAALVTAGELSLKLGDLSGAAALFARADKIDPRDGRVKAGMGSVLVRSERPGEALRFFQQAERDGLAPAAFAADRGLAYDLIGQPARAQADYRTALASARTDETLRRYALSLGISGQRDLALEQLDPLVRRQDRAAWRARAFVLAMNGDTAGANKIATTMMPAQLAQGLGAFFARLPALSATDRAFAVHFGEVYPTPERLADAKLTPPLPAFNGPTGAVQVAAADPIPRPTQTFTPSVRQPVQARPVQTRPSQSRPTRVAEQPQLAGRTTPPATVAARPVESVAAAPAVVMGPPREVAQTVPAAPPPPVRQAPPVQVAAASTSAPAPASVAPVQSRASTQRADAVLARIVASLTIPASELGVEDPAPAVPPAVAAEPASSAGRRVLAGASIKEARDTAVRRAVAAKLTGDAAADDPAPTTRALRSARADRSATADKDAALTPAQKRAADRKARAEKEAAAEKKALADKAAAEKKAAKANPSRIWVQVASGANEGDLAKAWSAAKAKAPTAFAGRNGYTTPLRATNRVLTGPFKTDAEARAFVNKLKKEGVSSYAVTSEAGQQVDRLPSK